MWGAACVLHHLYGWSVRSNLLRHRVQFTRRLGALSRRRAPASQPRGRLGRSIADPLKTLQETVAALGGGSSARGRFAFCRGFREYCCEDEANHLDFRFHSDCRRHRDGAGACGSGRATTSSSRTEPGLAAAAANGDAADLPGRADSGRRGAIYFAVWFLSRPRCRRWRNRTGPYAFSASRRRHTW